METGIPSRAEDILRVLEEDFEATLFFRDGKLRVYSERGIPSNFLDIANTFCEDIRSLLLKRVGFCPLETFDHAPPLQQMEAIYQGKRVYSELVTAQV